MGVWNMKSPNTVIVDCLCVRCDVTAEQGCEGRDEFTNGSPRDPWVSGEGGWKGRVGNGACWGE